MVLIFVRRSQLIDIHCSLGYNKQDSHSVNIRCYVEGLYSEIRAHFGIDSVEKFGC